MKELICVSGFDTEKLKAVKAAGFELVEVFFGQVAQMQESELKEYLDLLKDIGLKPVAGNGFFPWGWSGFFTDEFDIGKIREYIASGFEKTACMNWGSIAFGSGFMRRIPDGMSYDKAFDFMTGFLSDEVVPYLEKYNATLSIEELQATETNFLNSCAETAKLVEAVNNPRVGLLCDFFHMSMAGETAKDVYSFGKHITHVHIASPSNSRAIPVENDGDNEKYKAFFKALEDVKYKSGYISVEGAIPENVDFASAVKETREYLAKELAPFGK